MYLISIISLVAFVGIWKCTNFGNWTKNKYSQFKILKSLLLNLMYPTQNNSSNSESIGCKFEIDNRDTSKTATQEHDTNAFLQYEHYNQKYRLYVPYCRHYVVKMIPFKAELILQDGQRKDITQQPGIPYLICATDMGGSAIEIINQDTGSSYLYEDKVCPEYALEVME